MSVQNLGKQTMRVVKNYTKGYTDTQLRVREATTNDAWGPSGTQMNEISQLTFNQQDFIEVMEMLDKRLNDKGKNWRHVFKSLTLLDYLLHAGSENVVLYFKENLYVVKTLREFVYVDDDGKDQGANVRQKAKDITSLLMDDERLRQARKGRASMRDRMSGGDRLSPPPSQPSTRPRSRTTGSRPNRNEDDELQRAIEESKRLAEQQAAGPKRGGGDEDDLQRAIRMSQEEEERRKAELARNQNGLFDEQQQQQSQPDQLIDFNSNMQPQQTGMMPQYTGMPMQQFNSYNPFAAQQQAQQEEYMRMLEMQRQMQEQQQQQAYQQMMQQQAYQQQQQQWLMSQPTGQPLVPQPTAFGSNNPFAAFSQESQQPPPMPSFSASPTPQPQQQQLQPQQEPPRPASTGAAFPKRNNANDERHAQLAAMLGSGGSGIDTYGNIGNLRVPTGSAFHPTNRMQPQATGAGNPFQRSASQPQHPQQGADQPFFQL